MRARSNFDQEGAQKSLCIYVQNIYIYIFFFLRGGNISIPKYRALPVRAGGQPVGNPEEPEWRRGEGARGVGQTQGRRPNVAHTTCTHSHTYTTLRYGLYRWRLSSLRRLHYSTGRYLRLTNPSYIIDRLQTT
jgi:hypothetical protein